MHHVRQVAGQSSLAASLPAFACQWFRNLSTSSRRLAPDNPRPPAKPRSAAVGFQSSGNLVARRRSAPEDPALAGSLLLRVLSSLVLYMGFARRALCDFKGLEARPPSDPPPTPSGPPADRGGVEGGLPGGLALRTPIFSISDAALLLVILPSGVRAILPPSINFWRFLRKARTC